MAIGFAAARTALELLDAAETTYLDSLARPTDEQLEASSHRVAVLVHVRELLEALRPRLADSEPTDLKSVLQTLAELLDLAGAAGIKLPPAIVAQIQILHEVVR